MKNKKFNGRRCFVLFVVLVSVPGFIINNWFNYIDEYKCLESLFQETQAFLYKWNDTLTNCYDLLEDRFFSSNTTTLFKAIKNCEVCVQKAKSTSDVHVLIYAVLSGTLIVCLEVIFPSCTSIFLRCPRCFQTCKIFRRERLSDSVSDSAVNNELRSDCNDTHMDIISNRELDGSSSYLEVSSEHGSSYLEVRSERGSIDDNTCCNPFVVLPKVNVISRW